MAQSLLIVAGMLSMAISAFHLVAAFSPSLCRYFRAPERLLAAGPMVLAIVTLVVAAVFACWGLYAFSAAGWLPRLPLLLPGLLAIGAIYTLRGLLVVPQMLAKAHLIRLNTPVEMCDLVSSMVSLVIGIAYFAATATGWQSLLHP